MGIFNAHTIILCHFSGGQKSDQKTRAGRKIFANARTKQNKKEWDGRPKALLDINLAKLAKIPKSTVGGHTDDWEIIYHVYAEDGKGELVDKPFFLSPSQTLAFDKNNRSMNIQFGEEFYVKAYKDGQYVGEGALSGLKDEMKMAGTYQYGIYGSKSDAKPLFQITAIVK